MTNDRPECPADRATALAAFGIGNRDRLLCALVLGLCPRSPVAELCDLVRRGVCPGPLTTSDLAALDAALAAASKRARGERRERLAAARRHVRVSFDRLRGPRA